MISKKKMLATVLYHSKLLELLKGQKDFLIIFNYHRIRKEKYCSTMFDSGIFGPNEIEFEKHLKWLKSCTEIISEKELFDFICAGKSIKGRYSLITFDDGYIDNYTLAYPLLKRNNIPAIFFIPTDAICNRKLGWWDIISYMVKKTKQNEIIYQGRKVYPLKHPKDTINFFLQEKKLQKNTEDMLDILSNLCKVDFPDPDSQDQELMTWDQIIELSENNMSIGSHTCNHSVLATINSKEQEYQIKESKKKIQKIINKSVISISYPVGNYEHFNNNTKLIAKSCGYKMGFSFNTGINVDLNESFNIKRIFPPESIELFASTVSFPKVFV